MTSVANFGNSHVFRSNDAGSTWTDIDGGKLPDVPHHALLIRPDKPSELYVCNDAGVFLTTDGGTTWRNATGKLPNVMVVDLVLPAAPPRRCSRRPTAAASGSSRSRDRRPGRPDEERLTRVLPCRLRRGGPAPLKRLGAFAQVAWPLPDLFRDRRDLGDRGLTTPIAPSSRVGWGADRHRCVRDRAARRHRMIRIREGSRENRSMLCTGGTA